MYIASVAHWSPTYTFMRIFDLSSKFLSRGNVVYLAVFSNACLVCLSHLHNGSELFHRLETPPFYFLHNIHFEETPTGSSQFRL